MGGLSKVILNYISQNCDLIMIYEIDMKKNPGDGCVGKDNLESCSSYQSF